VGGIFFVNQCLAAFSFPVAAWLSKRIGLVNTMVYTHLPSNFCLIAMPFCNFHATLALILARGLTSQMDVPARESFMTGVVPKDERVACARTAMLARAAACALGPLAAAALWEKYGAAAPLVFAGVAKSVYDLLMLFVFRAVKPPEEANAPTRIAIPRAGSEKALLLQQPGENA